MIKLKDLLKEDDIVKNKKTGNVYMVKKMDPAKHDKPTPAEVEKTDSPAVFEIYGYKPGNSSFVKSISLKTEITNNLATGVTAPVRPT